MTGFVDADEGEELGLLDLAVYDVVGCADVDVASGRVAGGSNHVGDNFAADPVADVITAQR